MFVAGPVFVAYSCKAYSRVVDGAMDRYERLRRAEAFADGHHFPVDAVDMPEAIDIVRAAAASRSGWKLILARCAPVRRRRQA